MPYEKIVLTDGMVVLFAVPEEPQETGPSEVETLRAPPGCWWLPSLQRAA